MNRQVKGYPEYDPFQPRGADGKWTESGGIEGLFPRNEPIPGYHMGWNDREEVKAQEVREPAKKIFRGRDIEPDKLAQLSGAPNGATVRMRGIGSRIDMSVLQEQGVGRMDREVYQVDGDIVLENKNLFLDRPGQGLGFDIFRTQVETARELGVDRIKTYAWRDAETKANGYYTWPRFGYDAPIPRGMTGLLPESLGTARRVSDLMRTQAGRDWWKENGVSLEMEFDLREGSRSMMLFEAYVRQRAERAGKGYPEYNPSQPRDDGGQWSGGGVNSPAAPRTPPKGKFTNDIVGADETTPTALKRDIKVIFKRAVSADELAEITGAPGGATVKIGREGNSILLSLDTESGGDHGIVDLRRTIERRGNEIIMHNEHFALDPDYQGQGRGWEVFSAQVEAARAAGVNRIRTWAARDEDMNGYYTWARFGYDAPLSADIRKKLPPNMRSATRLRHLMRQPDGRTWWRQNGEAMDMEFDLSDGGFSMQVFERYRQEIASRTGQRKELVA